MSPTSAAVYIAEASHGCAPTDSMSSSSTPCARAHSRRSDAIDYRFDRIEEAMVFGRADDRAPLAGYG